MRKNSHRLRNQRPRAGWRTYQNDLQKQRHTRPLWLKMTVRLTLIVLLATAGLAAFQALSANEPAPSRATTAHASLPATPGPKPISRQDIRQLLDRQAFTNLSEQNLELLINRQVLRVETSLDADLQTYLLNRMDREHSRYIGIVVMEADTGRVLAMAGFDKLDQKGNPCLRSNFPAASVFKIVTAASAVDHCSYTAESPMHFNGYKHTLYKRQLKEATNRHTNTVSFKDAFAQSVNPVFGKIGELQLGGPLLEQSADAFGFNKRLDFDLPLPPSHFEIKDRPYYCAELASGFNRDTTISPLHGAMIASAVLNKGRMIRPSIVDRIVDAGGHERYHSQPTSGMQAMSAKASSVLNKLMQTTVRSGTARKAFRGYRHDAVLSHLTIGGKTGTIDNRSHDARYDWFVGFARECQGRGQVVVAAMVAHEKYIGIRASEYARMAISHHFRQQLASRQPDGSPRDG
jgi:cell division protein FtsI/penicillin-binding protein 2